MRMPARSRFMVITAGVAVGLTALGTFSAPLAGAASKAVQIGNFTSVTVPSGWKVSHPEAGKLAITKNSPHAVIEIEAAPGETGTVVANETTNVTQFMSGFGMTHVKVTAKQSEQIPGGGKFDEAATETYTGQYQGTKLGGAAVMYQNSKTGDAAFAIVVAQQSDKPKLKKAVNQMFNSIAADK
jgi:hypothetical protein